MKKTLLFVFLFFAFTLSVYSQGYVKVISIKANLRGTPDNQGVVVTTVNQNETFELIQQKNAWYLIQTPKYVGWIHGNSIQLVNSYNEKSVVEENVGVGVNNNTEFLNYSEDKGYDIVKPSSRLFMYDSPNGSTIIALSPGDQIVLLNRSHSSGWLNVLDINTGREGWVYYKQIKIYFTRSPKRSESVFESKYTGSNQPPSVTISNDTDRVLTVRLGSELFTIPAKSSKVMNISAGAYKFYASVPRAYPLLGEESFSNGHIYTWSFYIAPK